MRYARTDPSSAPPSDPLTTRPVARGDRSNQLVPLKAASCRSYEVILNGGNVGSTDVQSWHTGSSQAPCLTHVEVCTLTVVVYKRMHYMQQREDEE